MPDSPLPRPPGAPTAGGGPSAGRGATGTGRPRLGPRPTVAWPLFALALTGCGDAPPEPTFAPVLPPVPAEYMSLSSPNLAELDGDDVLDIVYGIGVDRLQQPTGEPWYFSDEPAVPGYVIALSGATNEILWKSPHPGEPYTTARFADLDGDGVDDPVMGGREGAFVAYRGPDGSVLWRVDPVDIAPTPVPYNFSTPALLGDVDGDGVTDFVVGYGGDATRKAEHPRDPGFLTVISGAEGTVVAAHETPDGAETYASPIVYERADGTPWVVFGTGGETMTGSSFRAPVASLLDGTFPEVVERLTTPGPKGVMAPATVVELTGDDEPDLAISTFDGRLVVLDGATLDVLWEQEGRGEESYHPAAVTRIARDGTVGLLLSRGIGVFPFYQGTVHRLFHGTDGTLLYLERVPTFPAGAPLAVDLTDDGIEELFFFDDPGHVRVYHGPSEELIVHDLGANFSATPLIADPRGVGTLELLGASWENRAAGQGVADWRDLSSRFLRLDLNADRPEFIGWGGYMGTRTDGRYRPPQPPPR